jgi:hypothetical protein
LCLHAIPVALIIFFWGQAQAAPRYLPKASDVVGTSVHSLGAGYSNFKKAEAAWIVDPSNQDLAGAYARQSFLLGLKHADLRWLGLAKKALDPWWNEGSLASADLYFIRGLVKQGFHDFSSGLADINHALAIEKTRAEFWSWRFAIHMTLSDLQSAREDCINIQISVSATEARACKAVLDYRTGAPLIAITNLRGLLLHHDNQGPTAQEWLMFHLAEAQKAANRLMDSEVTLKTYLEKNPESHLIRLSLLELLNLQGKYEETLIYAQQPTLSDALLVQRCIAASQRGLLTEATRLEQQIKGRFEAQKQRREHLIERPQLIYFIRHGADLQAGFQLARKNWETQKEPADALLLLEASVKLQQKREAQVILDWLKLTGYSAPDMLSMVNLAKETMGLD